VSGAADEPYDAMVSETGDIELDLDLAPQSVFLVEVAAR
jgi:hypothetical protein